MSSNIGTIFGVGASSYQNIRTPIFGTEYEIEDVLDNEITEELSGVIAVTEDHSLRNNGYEFITKPLDYYESIEVFNKLHDTLDLGPEPYTHRTSTHVHMNVCSYTEEELHLLILAYAALEPVFFAFVGESRKSNIHCVPLNYTLLPKYYNKDVTYLTSSDTWSKYTAFNLLPVRTIGTVEFRHLYGTGDVSVYSKWLGLLKDLHEYVTTHTEADFLKLLTSGNYRELQLTILPSSYNIKASEQEAYTSLLDTKLAFL